jgi:hypothetical protein
MKLNIPYTDSIIHNHLLSITEMFKNGGLVELENTPEPVKEVNICPISEEIQQLHLRILELEKQKQKKEEHDKKTSFDHNVKVVTDLIHDKKKEIANNKYSKTAPFAKYYDQQLVTHLEAISNILQILDQRLTKIEEK